MVSVECMELVASWQCVVSSMGDALCMVCNVWNIIQARLKPSVAFLTGYPTWRLCRVHGACDVLAIHGKFNG